MGWIEGAVIVYFIVTFSRRCLNLCGLVLVGKLEFWWHYDKDGRRACQILVQCPVFRILLLGWMSDYA